jgi:hypothetical protein
VIIDFELGAMIEQVDDLAHVLLRSAEGNPVALAKEYGKGKLILCTTGDLYSNPSIGQPSTVPDARQAVIIRSSFRLLGEAVEWEKNQAMYERAWELFLQKSTKEMSVDEREVTK